MKFEYLQIVCSVSTENLKLLGWNSSRDEYSTEAEGHIKEVAELLNRVGEDGWELKTHSERHFMSGSDRPFAGGVEMASWSIYTFVRELN